MIYQPEFQYSQEAIDKHTISNAKVFHADCRLHVKGTHVEFYVACWQGDQYFTDFGHFDDPEAEIERIKQLPEWQEDVVNGFSAASMVRKAIADTPKFKWSE